MKIVILILVFLFTNEHIFSQKKMDTIRGEIIGKDKIFECCNNRKGTMILKLDSVENEKYILRIQDYNSILDLKVDSKNLYSGSLVVYVYKINKRETKRRMISSAFKLDTLAVKNIFNYFFENKLDTLYTWDKLLSRFIKQNNILPAICTDGHTITIDYENTMIKKRVVCRCVGMDIELNNRNEVYHFYEYYSSIILLKEKFNNFIKKLPRGRYLRNGLFILNVK